MVLVVKPRPSLLEVVQDPAAPRRIPYIAPTFTGLAIYSTLRFLLSQCVETYLTEWAILLTIWMSTKVMLNRQVYLP